MIPLWLYWVPILEAKRELRIEELQAKKKLNQDKPDEELHSPVRDRNVKVPYPFQELPKLRIVMAENIDFGPRQN
jgi:hypothetical protein